MIEIFLGLIAAIIIAMGNGLAAGGFALLMLKPGPFGIFSLIKRIPAMNCDVCRMGWLAFGFTAAWCAAGVLAFGVEFVVLAMVAGAMAWGVALGIGFMVYGYAGVMID